jgi:hypothetical protein
LLLALPIGLLAVALIPPMQELDGTAHLLRVDQISRGTLVQPLNRHGAAIVVPDACLQGFITAHIELGLRPGPMSPRNSLSRQPCRTPEPRDISNTAMNSPVTYLPQVVGYRVGHTLGGTRGAFFGARLIGLLVYVWLCWSALRLAPRGKALLFVVALLPSSLQLASVVSSDGFTIGLALLSVALVLRLRAGAESDGSGTTRRDLVLLAVALLVLSISKNLYAPMALLPLLIPAAAFRADRQRRTYQGGVLAASVLIAGSWSLLVVGRIRIAYPGLRIDSFAARDWAGEHPVAFGASMVRGLWDPWVAEHSLPGYVEVLGKFRPAFSNELFTLGDRAPLWLFGAAVVLLALALVHDARTGAPVAGEDLGAGDGDDEPVRRIRRRGDLALVCAATGTVIFVSMMLIFGGDRLVATPFDSNSTQWVQGRYFLPLTPLLALPVTAFWAGARRGPRWAWVIPFGSMLLLAWVIRRAIILFYYQAALR